MKRKRKLFKNFAVAALCLVIGVIFAVPSYASTTDPVKFTNDNGIKITDADYDRLIGLGFSDNDIEQIDQQEYDLNKGLHGTEISSNTRYYKVIEKSDLMPTTYSNTLSTIKPTSTAVSDYVIELSQDEYQKEVTAAKQQSDSSDTGKFSPMNNPDSNSTSYKKMTTQIISLGSREYRIRNSVTWNVLPKTRSYDVIGTAINSSQFRPMPGTQYGKQYWTLKDVYSGDYSNVSSTYSSSSSYWSKTAAGYGTKMNLKNDNVVYTGFGGGARETGTRVTDLSMYAYYSVDELHYNNENVIDAYGRYAHAQKNLSVHFGFGISLSGIGITFSSVSSTSFSVQHNTQAVLHI